MDSGCYQLKIEITKNIGLKIGALGVCRFAKGNYVYTGSAMKNLSKRVARHRRKEKKMHWHIDYLLAHPAVKLAETVVFPSENREECLRNQQLMNEGAESVILKFGSSDCKICPSHLLKI